MSLRAKLILSFVVASLGGMFFFSYVAYDISVVSGVKRERAILQEFSQSLLPQFSGAMETPSLAQLKRAIPGRGGKRIVILLTGQNRDILFTEPPLHQLETDFRNFIIPNILQEKDVKGYLVHNGMFYTWIETPVPNTPYSTLVIHTVPDKELASFFKTLLSTPLVIATLIVFWVALWGALIIASLFDKVGKQQSLLEHQALYDNLTGLPNRALFDDRLRQAILIGRRDKQPFALIAMDLDRFKEINDSLGHHAGDRVLQHVAECARASLRDSDTVARMGGDEFTVLLATANNIDGALAVAQKILKALEAPLELSGQKIEIGASLGIVMFPEHGEGPEALLRRADAAMYQAKQSHGGYKVYSKELGQGTDDRTALQGELRRAIANDELVLYYQPKIVFSSDRISGVEALVRWQHPQHGLLPPDKFIPLAEHTGLIKSMTLHILRIALRQCEQWQRAGLNLTMSVNISAINIQDPEFPDQMAKLLKEFTVSPARLELEITETVVMSEPVRAVACIKKLSALGLQISIDDFGTGYSSMAYLKELLVAKIKIDKSFVKDMAVNHNYAVIVRSTIELGHNLGLKVIAEGVETQACWDKLKMLGCDSAQGYHMSRPLPADKFMDWLERSPWGTKT